MNSVVIIESPFQLLSAVEAKNAFSIEKLIVIVKYTNNPKTNNQIDWILSKNSFYKIIKLPKFETITLNDFLLSFIIFGWKVKRKRFDYILVGEPRSVIMNCFILNLTSNKHYFLDDGSTTIAIQNQIINNNKYILTETNKSFLISLRSILFKVIGIKCYFNISPNFFTCFNLTPIKNQEIIQHKFDHILKTTTNKKERNDNLVYFIGSNLSEVDILSEKDELFLFSKIIKFYQKRKLNIIYCCHRLESKDKLDKIKSLDKTIEFYYPEFPIELDFIIRGIHINSISSYYSTALYTSTLIFKPIQSNLFKIPSEFINIRYRESVESIELNYTINSLIQLERDYIYINEL